MRALRTLSVMLTLVLLILSIPVNTAYAYNMPYYIEVDLENNIVTVFSSLDDSIVRQMICSSGTLKYPSPVGTFYMTKKRREAERSEWYTFEDGYGKYGSRIVGNYLFHSYLFLEMDDDKVDMEALTAMGTHASHGCIRLFIDDAKWIADNCLAGTRVKLYHNDKRYEYLKEILFEETFSIDNGVSYEEFLCMASSDDELGYYSQGEDVVALQERMIVLGLYSGEADGFYGEKMVTAVKAIQAVLGRRVTGVVDAELLAILNSDDAPSSTISTLSEGMSGPAVRSLQQILAALGLYHGDFTGEFDEETTEAVKSFQRALGKDPTGIATAGLQQNMLDSFAYLDSTYAETGYALIYEEETHETATINASKKLNVRAKKSTDSSIVARLEPGTEVDVLDKSDGWAKIQHGETIGYVKASYLDITETTIQVPKYIAADANNPALPTPVYGENVIKTRQATYGTVNIEERLRIREAPDTDAEVLFMISEHNVVEIISVNDGWAYVSYGGKSGFTLLKYFDVEETAELTNTYISNAPAEETVEVVDDTAYAMVISDTAAPVMSAASSGSDIVGYLENGERAEIIFKSTSWTQIRTDDIVGYISNDNITIGTSAELDEYLYGSNDTAFAEDEFVDSEITDNVIIADETIIDEGNIDNDTGTADFETEEEAIDDSTEFSEEGTETESEPVVSLVVVETGSDATLNLRDIPSSDGNVLAELENGTELTLIGTIGDWSNVGYNGTTGYVMTKYVVPADSVEETPVEEPAVPSEN